MRTATLTIPARFNGPPDSGNGGYLGGLLARAIDADGAGGVEVTLRAPAPLDRALFVDADGDGVALRDDDVVVASARPTSIDLDSPPPVGLDVAAEASGRGPFLDVERHPFPRCFVCGPARAEGDGLRIFVGPVDGAYHRVFAGAWTPPAELADDDGVLPSELVWAALDCPTSGPVANDPGQPGFLPIVLGRLAVRIDRAVVAGRPYSVLAWPLAVDGRKRHSAAALFTADGELCAVSRALWIELRDG